MSSMYGYIGGQHLYPSARKAAKKKTPQIVWTKATQTGSGTFAGIRDLAGRVGRPAAGGQQQGGGGNPYADLINNMLNQTRADIRSESVADAASRDAAIRRLLISFGETPDLASLGISGEASGVLGKVMDEKTRGLAAANTAEGTSIKARIEDANRVAQQAIPSTLAGRGLARSGETGYQLGRQAMQHKQTTFDTLNEMLGNVEGAVGSYAANERARQRALAEAANQAAWQLATSWEDTNFGAPGGGGDDGSTTMGRYGGLTEQESGPGGSLHGVSSGMLSRNQWLAMHPGGNYDNYARAYRARNRSQPIYMGGAYRY